MWKRMLKTELLEIRMDESNRLFEVQLYGNIEDTIPVVRLGHADLIELMHTLLEINRTFRGDLPYYAAGEKSEQSTHSFIDRQNQPKLPVSAEKSTSASMHA
ncbi:hypothetical protein [Paenibacillus sedimenti]|uniref:Uncharacterized protein n=1 Tax=Paenibacillus sedimenti TaxID=2770274 RepID=A0A926KPB2_9BACL|nr:hypothetical protein [Paenibacillus sedimenti]MBD0381007.1 hypothetical protein [Paenibacillus sedimenti]